MKEINTALCYDMHTLQEAIPIGKNLLGTLVHSEGFPSVKVGRRIIVPKKALEKWLLEQAEAGTQI